MELKDCPFCGSTASLITRDDQSDYCFKNGKMIQYYDVGCDDNHCYLGDGAGYHHETPKEAADLWNRRGKGPERERKLNELGI